MVQMVFATHDLYRQNIAAFTLSELNAAIKEAVETAFPETVWLIAEIAEIRCNVRGHCYLELIEREGEKTKAQIRANIWAYAFRGIAAAFEKATGESLRQGMKVLLQVSVTFHEVYGLSLNIRDIDPAYSLGEMARKKREIIERLAKEGLLHLNKQIDLPIIAQRIAVISSSSAAGYGDFTNHLDNNPFHYKITYKLYQSSMQGGEAVADITAALHNISRERDLYDAVVIIRGGGSQIDLNCFDTYDLAVAVARCPLPVITGIGHERDDTVVDLVAHTKLKTPTAVAEFLLSAMNSFEEKIINAEKALTALARQRCRMETHRLGYLAQQFRHNARDRLSHERAVIDALLLKIMHGVTRLIHQHGNTIETRIRSITGGLNLYFEKRANALTHYAQAVKLLDPSNVLQRGFSITYYRGKALTDGSIVGRGDMIETKCFKGFIKSRVEESHVEE